MLSYVSLIIAAIAVLRVHRLRLAAAPARSRRAAQPRYRQTA